MTTKWIKTHCSRFDHGGCGLKIQVDQTSGKALNVFPDRNNPRSSGYICSKGKATLERIEHPQRLLSPLKRKNGRWEKISWSHALEYAASRLNKTKSQLGAKGVAFAQGAPKGLEYLLLMRLANVFGSPTIAGTQHVCHMPRELMGRYTCGFLPVPDYDMPTKCILLWGSNPYHTNEEGILGIHLKRSLEKNNPKLIVVDPFKSKIAGKADLWLQIKPGTDDLLALGFLHLIISKRWYNKDFVRNWATGFEALRAHVQQYTPDLVSKNTWVPKELIIRAAKAYSNNSPALLHSGNAIENNGINTSQTCRALYILIAITGNLDVPGGNIKAPVPKVMSLRKFTCSDHLKDHEKKLIQRYYHITPRLPLAPSSLLIKTILEKKPYEIGSLFIQGSNPLLSYADAKKVHKALSTLDFIMVSDLFMTPTAALADLVLPAATNLEYNDIGHYGLPHGYILARPKVINPRGECWPDIKIINELGKHLGLEEFFWKDMQQCLEDILRPSGLNYSIFSKQGILKGDKSYYQYKIKGFKTPSSKIEIYSKQMENEGFTPLPTANLNKIRNHVYPLIMISSKPKYFFHSGYLQLDSLRKLEGKPRLKIHPKIAGDHQINKGDTVKIITDNGAILLKAEITTSLNPNVVMADYGRWLPKISKTSLRSWKNHNINILTSCTPPYDPILGTTPLRSIPCRIEKYNPPDEIE